MSTTITGKLNKHAQIFPAGESTGFGIRLGVKFYNRDTKQEEWTNYQAVVFAKAAAQVQFYTQALVEGAIVEISGDKQRIRQFQGQNGLQLSIEILDAKLGFIGGNPVQAGAQQTNRAPAASNQAPAYNQPGAGYGQQNRQPAVEPAIDFSDDIPF